MEKKVIHTAQEFYNQKSVANNYDKVAEEQADYQIPKLLNQFYQKNQINSGSILDLGCGTGKIAEQLHGNFQLTGIDYSDNMILHARERYDKLIIGNMIDEILKFPDKSFDHTIALSSLVFLSPSQFDNILFHMERVTKVSLFFNVEDLNPSIKLHDVPLYNHTVNNMDSFYHKMWYSMLNKCDIYGRIYSKILL